MAIVQTRRRQYLTLQRTRLISALKQDPMPLSPRLSLIMPILTLAVIGKEGGRGAVAPAVGVLADKERSGLAPVPAVLIMTIRSGK